MDIELATLVLTGVNLLDNNSNKARNEPLLPDASTQIRNVR